MAKKLRCIYIDGLDNSGKNSVFKEIRKYLKFKDIQLKEIKNTEDKDLELQNSLLNTNQDFIILKEGSVFSFFQQDIKNGLTITSITEKYRETLRKEQDINHRHGSVCFFLIPYDILEFKQNTLGISECYNFFKNIGNYSASQGLDIVLIFFNLEDKIFDIKDKIINILQQKYII